MADYKARLVRKDSLLISILLLISAAIFWVDLMIPLGVAAGVPYFAVVLVAARVLAAQYRFVCRTWDRANTFGWL